MTRLLASVLIAALIVLPAAWLGGFNFDHRGEGAFSLYLLVLGIAFIAYAYPGWTEWEMARELRKGLRTSGFSK